MARFAALGYGDLVPLVIQIAPVQIEPVTPRLLRFGLEDVANGMAQHHGYCVGTDPAGDQLVGDVANDRKYALGAQDEGGTLQWTTGTGKFAGITGGHKYLCRLFTGQLAAEGPLLVES